MERRTDEPRIDPAVVGQERGSGDRDEHAVAKFLGINLLVWAAAAIVFAAGVVVIVVYIL